MRVRTLAVAGLAILSGIGGPAGAATGELCTRLLPDSARFLTSMLDLWTGLPYDQVPCGGPYAGEPTGVNPAFGVVPQLAYASIDAFAEDPARRAQTVEWAFVDAGPAGLAPELLHALRISLHLRRSGVPPNRFGGLIWNAAANVRRYRAVRIRYSTSTPGAVWELKLNLGRATRRESSVLLPGSAPGQWREARFELGSAFPGPAEAAGPFLNYLVLAAHADRGPLNPVIWVDRISFEANPARAGTCAALCPAAGELDLACHEPYTGVVNVANALTALSLLPKAGLIAAAEAKDKVARILTTLEGLPGGPHGRWFQDWHSPVSGMPDPRNRVSSLTDQPQLYAALMVVEQSWPSLRARAAALRARMDLALLYDPGAGCPGTLYGALDRCAGVVTDWHVELYGTESVFGAFLAIATGAAPACLWSGLAVHGCALDGPPGAGWFTPGGCAAPVAIPAADNGGPFLQLASLQYLGPDRLRPGPLTLGESARNMLAAQDAFAADGELALAGWANASDPDRCAYDTCAQFEAAKVTPYAWLMGLDLYPPAAQRVAAFLAAGADALLATGSREHAFGLRDAWNQETGSGRDAYLYLDTGWSTLGLLNSCHAGLVRRWFARHPVARAGYAALSGLQPPCE